MENSKVLLIVNPVSGKMKARNGIFDIVDRFSKRNNDITVRTTSCRGDATRLAIEKSCDYDAVICCGGDGTLNEVVSGMMQCPEKKPIGYIPCGSTNDFANNFGIPLSIPAATETILGNEPRSIDVGLFEGDGRSGFFTYTASFGAFASASYSAPQQVKNALGHLAYILEGMKTIPNIRPIHIEAEFNGNLYSEDILFGAITNSVSLGGVINIRKDLVDLNDGLFEVILIKAPKLPSELTRILVAINSKTYDDPLIIFDKTSEIKIRTIEPVSWTLDGEFGGTNNCVSVKNFRSGVELIV